MRCRSAASGFPLKCAKLLILLGSRDCCEKGQYVRELGKSRVWRFCRAVTHKDIHRSSGQGKKPFRIMGLPLVPQLIPSYRRQLHGPLL
jgi:hypothetical protein